MFLEVKESNVYYQINLYYTAIEYINVCYSLISVGKPMLVFVAAAASRVISK